MQYFKSLIEQSLSRCREATLGVLGINDSGLRQHLAAQMNNTLGSDGCFLAPPVFEHTFGWEESDVTLADLKGKLLSEALISTLKMPMLISFHPVHPHTSTSLKPGRRYWLTNQCQPL